jgi:hypothetical protein
MVKSICTNVLISGSCGLCQEVFLTKSKNISPRILRGLTRVNGTQFWTCGMMAHVQDCMLLSLSVCTKADGID